MAGTSKTDELDAVVNLESGFHAEGTQDSQEASAKAGHEDGRQIGWAAGSSLSTELSFYHGAAQALLTLSETHPNTVPPKAIETAQRLVTESKAHQIHQLGNDANMDMQAHAEAMRSLFSSSMAQAGLIVRYERASSRMSDLSF